MSSYFPQRQFAAMSTTQRPPSAANTSSGAGAYSNVASTSYNQSQGDYNPNERNSNFRPQLNYFRPRQFYRGVKRLIHNNYRRNNQNRSSPMPPRSLSSSTINENSRHKGFSVGYYRNEKESIKVTLHKIADNLDTSLLRLRTLGFAKDSRNEHKLILFCSNKAPYTKVGIKMEEQENLMLNGTGCENLPFYYEGPQSLEGPLANGDILASVRTCETLFPVKLSRPEGERNIIEALELLTEWRETRFGQMPMLIEDTVHSIRLSKKEIHFTFNLEEFRDNLYEFTTRNGLYSVSKDASPTVISVSPGPSPRTKRNILKVTNDMTNLFKVLGNLTPQMIEWCKLLGTGNYDIVEKEKPEDSAMRAAEEQMQSITITPTLDNIELMDVQQEALLNPLIPSISNTQDQKT